MWLHSLKVAQLLRSAACLHTNQSRSYLNHLVFSKLFLEYVIFTDLTLIRVNYSVANHHVVTGVLEGVDRQTGTEPIPET